MCKDAWGVGDCDHSPVAEVVWLKELLNVGTHLAGIPVLLQTTIWLWYSEWWKLLVTKFWTVCFCIVLQCLWLTFSSVWLTFSLVVFCLFVCLVFPDNMISISGSFHYSGAKHLLNDLLVVANDAMPNTCTSSVSPLPDFQHTFSRPAFKYN